MHLQGENGSPLRPYLQKQPDLKAFVCRGLHVYNILLRFLELSFPTGASCFRIYQRHTGLPRHCQVQTFGCKFVPGSPEPDSEYTKPSWNCSSASSLACFGSMMFTLRLHAKLTVLDLGPGPGELGLE